MGAAPAPGRQPEAAFDPAQPLAFMHIPKTAGTSMIATLASALAPCRVVTGFDRVLFGGYADFDSFGSPAREAVHLALDGLPEADLVAGHMAWSSLRGRYASAQLVTVLREPFSRLLSQWLFWRGHEAPQLIQWGSWADRVRLSRLPLADFLAHPDLACQTDNLAVRMLLWPHRLIPPDAFIHDRHDAILLTEARLRLAAFSFVDIVENPDFPGRLQGWLRRMATLERRNETAFMPPPVQGRLESELSDEALRLFGQRCRLDLALWRDVAGLRLAYHDPDLLREQAMLRSAARGAILLRGALA